MAFFESLCFHLVQSFSERFSCPSARRVKRSVMRLLNMSNSEEMKRLYEECKCSIQRIRDRIDDEKDKVKCNPFIDAIEQTYKKKNLAGMRHIAADLREWLGEFSKEDEMVLSYVIKKGCISNQREFRTVYRKVELLCSKSDKTKEIKLLNSFFANFER